MIDAPRRNFQTGCAPQRNILAKPIDVGSR